jgi:hypothetical protein
MTIQLGHPFIHCDHGMVPKLIARLCRIKRYLERHGHKFLTANERFDAPSAKYREQVADRDRALHHPSRYIRLRGSVE